MTREQARLILGVEISASSDDIRSAHRRVMRSVHPDTNRTEEAERFARMANEAREILDPPALADDPAPPAHEPTEGEFEAARHHLATAADVIRTYLNTDPEERRLNTDLEEPGLEPHVCELGLEGTDTPGRSRGRRGGRLHNGVPDGLSAERKQQRILDLQRRFVTERPRRAAPNGRGKVSKHQTVHNVH